MNPLLAVILVLAVALIFAGLKILDLRADKRARDEAFEEPVENEWNWPLRDPRLP